MRRRNTRAGIFGNCRSGTLRFAKRISPTRQTKRNELRREEPYRTRCYPKHPFPSEASVIILRVDAFVERASKKNRTKKEPGNAPGSFLVEKTATQLPLVRVTLTVWPQKEPVTVAV